jgi:hypothetical protein
MEVELMPCTVHDEGLVVAQFNLIMNDDHMKNPYGLGIKKNILI